MQILPEWDPPTTATLFSRVFDMLCCRSVTVFTPVNTSLLIIIWEDVCREIEAALGVLVIVAIWTTCEVSLNCFKQKLVSWVLLSREPSRRALWRPFK